MMKSMVWSTALLVLWLSFMAWVEPAFAQTPSDFREPSVDTFALLVEAPASLRPRLGRVADVFVSQCLGCHNGEQTDGGYSMVTPAAMFMAGESRRRPIHLDPTAAPAEQLGELYRRIVSEDPEVRMPKDSPALDWEDIEAIREWLAVGATIDGSNDAPLESFVPSKILETPRWVRYPQPIAVSAMAIDAAAGRIFSSGAQEVLVWDWQGALQGRIPTRGRFVSDIEWNPASESLSISSGEPGRIGYVESVPWSHQTQRCNESARVVHWVARDVPLDLALSPSGDRLAIATSDGTVVVTAANSNQVLWRSAAHAAAVTSVDWSADGTMVVSSSRDRMAKSYDASTGEIQTGFVDHERTVASIRSLQMGCVTLDEAGELRVYPGGTSPNPRTSRGGFPQRTPKMVSDRETVFVPADGMVRRFRLRKEEVVESKDEDGKEKKKTNWIIDEVDPVRFEGAESKEFPLAIAIAPEHSETLAAGLSSGVILLWIPSHPEPVRIRNQP